MARSLRWVRPIALWVVVLIGFLALLWDEGGTSGSTLAHDGEMSRAIEQGASPSGAIEIVHEFAPAVRESQTPTQDPYAMRQASIRLLESNGMWSGGSAALVIESDGKPTGSTYDTDAHGVWKGSLPARPQRVVAVLGESEAFGILDSPLLDAEHHDVVVRVEANPSFVVTVSDSMDGKDLAPRARLSSQAGSVDGDPFHVRSDGRDVQTRIEEGRLRVTPVGKLPRTYWVAVDGYAAESFLHVAGTMRHAVALAPQATLEILCDEGMRVDLIRAGRRIEEIRHDDGPSTLRRTVPAGAWRVEGWCTKANSLRHVGVDVEVEAGASFFVDLTRIEPSTAGLDIRLTVAGGIARPEDIEVELLYQPNGDGQRLDEPHGWLEETLEDWRCVDAGRIYSRALAPLSSGSYTLRIGRLSILREIEVAPGEHQRIEVEPPVHVATRIEFEGWPASEFPIRLGWKPEAARFGAASVTIVRPNPDARIEVPPGPMLFFASGRLGSMAAVAQRIDPRESDPRVLIPAPAKPCSVHVDFLREGDPYLGIGIGRFEKRTGPGYLVRQSTSSKRGWARSFEFSLPGRYELEWQDGPAASFRFEIEVDLGATQRWVDLGDSTRSR